MIKKHSIGLTVLLIFSLLMIASCKKEKLVGYNSIYIGTWDWTGMSGGLTGGSTSQSPTPSDYNLRLEMYKNGKYKLYKNDKKIEVGRLKEISSILTFHNDGIIRKDDMISGNGIYNISNDGNTISVSPASCCDLIVYDFKRR